MALDSLTRIGLAAMTVTSPFRHRGPWERIGADGPTPVNAAWGAVGRLPTGRRADRLAGVLMSGQVEDEMMRFGKLVAGKLVILAISSAVPGWVRADDSASAQVNSPNVIVILTDDKD
jgi:hypothetical protein